MLTNDAKRAISDNVVSDVNANIASPQQPKRQVLSPEAALLFDPSVISRPLMVPEVCSIRVKNLEYRYRWVNYSGRNGQVYMQRKAQGFTNATAEDVDLLGGDATLDGGSFRAGDLILMKIRADIYDAAMKWNMEKALVLQRTRGMYLQGASSDVHSDAVATKHSVNEGAVQTSGKATPFIPDAKATEALFSRSALDGGKAAARAQTEEIRERIEADARAKRAERVEE